MFSSIATVGTMARVASGVSAVKAMPFDARKGRRCLRHPIYRNQPRDGELFMLWNDSHRRGGYRSVVRQDNLWRMCGGLRTARREGARP